MDHTPTKGVHHCENLDKNPNGLCEQCAQWTIGATRCDDKGANTVFLETQETCGSLRKCSGDLVTHDTSVQVKMSHP